MKTEQDLFNLMDEIFNSGNFNEALENLYNNKEEE
jgi:hypothetical protein